MREAVNAGKNVASADIKNPQNATPKTSTQITLEGIPPDN
jgi:hypothetical protein